MLGQDTGYHERPSKWLLQFVQIKARTVPQLGNVNIRSVITKFDSMYSRSAIINRCAASHWREAKGPQVCGGNLGECRKEARKNLGTKKKKCRNP
jgi:hypothetical protein